MTVRGLRRMGRAWARRQLYSFFSSLGTLMSHRTGTAMTILVLGVAMALPLGLYVTMDNLRGLDLARDHWGTLTVFLEVESGEADARTLATAVEGRFGAGVVLVSPDQGLQEFSDASGFDAALDMFEQNPLPWVLHVTPAADGALDIEEGVTQLAQWLDSQGQVGLVQVDYKWLKRLAGLLDLGNAFVAVLMVLLSLAVVVVVGNTIRLDVANRADEIQVLHLVGAGNGFIRQPFLYSGFWYGLLGAILAVLLLNLSLLYLSAPLERLLDAYGNRFEVSGLGVLGTLLALVGGGLLGTLGAWVSVRRYLRQFRLPEIPRRKATISGKS